jgi:hypothetical protein
MGLQLQVEVYQSLTETSEMEKLFISHSILLYAGFTKFLYSIHSG